MLDELLHELKELSGNLKLMLMLILFFSSLTAFGLFGMLMVVAYAVDVEAFNDLDEDEEE